MHRIIIQINLSERDISSHRLKKNINPKIKIKDTHLFRLRERYKDLLLSG